MRTKITKSICRVLVLIMLSLVCLPGMCVQAGEASAGLTDDFNDNSLTGWSQDANYRLTEAGGQLRIEAKKANNPWASFTYSFSPVNISDNPFVSVRVKTDTDYNLNVSIWDTNNKYAYTGDYIAGKEIVGGEFYSVYSFNFTGVAGVDLTSIKC